MSERQLKGLRDIIGVDMVHCLQALIRQHKHTAARNAREYFRVEMTRRIHRIPSGSDQMTRMQNHGSRIAAMSGVEQ
jgi:hypothetical protein